MDSRGTVPGANLHPDYAKRLEPARIGQMMTKKIVELHGAMEVESEPGVGSEFVLWNPAKHSFIL